MGKVIQPVLCVKYWHHQRDNGWPIMITKHIRLHLSKDVPKNENDALSSKYLCIKSITEMEAHRGV